MPRRFLPFLSALLLVAGCASVPPPEDEGPDGAEPLAEEPAEEPAAEKAEEKAAEKAEPKPEPKGRTRARFRS